MDSDSNEVNEDGMNYYQKGEIVIVEGVSAEDKCVDVAKIVEGE